MAKRFVDPFFPNRPVDDPDRFSGREDYVEEIVDALYQTANENPVHPLITGDRGIGKSSLLLQAQYLATGDNRLAKRLDIDKGVDVFDFVVIRHDADSDQNAYSLASSIMREANSSIASFMSGLDLEFDWFVKVKGKDEPISNISDLVSAFCKQVAKVSKGVKKSGKHGVLFFIDELDRLPKDCGVAAFFKLAAEKLARDNYRNVAFFGAGITGALPKLKLDHESIERTFREISIPRFDALETASILRQGFEKVGVTFNDEVLQHAFALSGGFPEPIHILGSEALSVDSDGHIDLTDLENAKFKLVKQVRRTSYRNVLEYAGSGKYQRILKAMATAKEKHVPLEHIGKETGYAQNEYSTNMGRLIERNVISKVARGKYEFVDPLLKEYIREFGVIDVPSEDQSLDEEDPGQAQE